MDTARTGRNGRIERVELAAWALVVAQVVHGFTTADTEAEGSAGLVGGLVLLVASLAAVYGLRLDRSWASRLTGSTGAVVAAGFVAYHAVPVHSPLTNPYLGEPVGAPAWISVAIAVGVGVWAFVESRRVPTFG